MYIYIYIYMSIYSYIYAAAAFRSIYHLIISCRYDPWEEDLVSHMPCIHIVALEIVPSSARQAMTGRPTGKQLISDATSCLGNSTSRLLIESVLTSDQYRRSNIETRNRNELPTLESTGTT